MTKLLGWLVLVTIVGMTSCERKGASGRATEEFLKYETLYQSGDVRTAEKALLDYREKLLQEQRRGTKGIDFDQALAIADARLFLVYRATGQTNKMEAHFRSSTDAFKRLASAKGRSQPSFTPASLEEIVEWFDRGLDVKWRKETQPQLEGH